MQKQKNQSLFDNINAQSAVFIYLFIDICMSVYCILNTVQCHDVILLFSGNKQAFYRLNDYLKRDGTPVFNYENNPKLQPLVPAEQIKLKQAFFRKVYLRKQGEKKSSN